MSADLLPGPGAPALALSLPLAWLTLLARDTLLLGLGVLLAALLGRPLRRLGGAGLGYGRWALPPLLLATAHLAPWLPSWATLAAIAERVGLSGLLPSAAALVLPPVRVVMDLGQPALLAGAWASWSAWLSGLWLAGALALAALQWASQRRYVARLSPCPDPAGPGSLPGRPTPPIWRGPAGSSPALLGLWRPRLVLPADFEQRFDATERALILAHEQVHRRRHDNAINLLALVLCLLHWFNPLAWWARGRLLRDQELACDLAVLRQHPAPLHRHYQQALLKAQGLDMSSPAPAPLVAAWHSHHPMIERIRMLKTHSRRPASRRARLLAQALLAGAALGAAGTVAAWQSAAEAPAAPTSGGKAPDTAIVSSPTGAASQNGGVLRAKDACPTMVRPDMALAPTEVENGHYTLTARWLLDAQGRISQIKLEGDARFQPAVRAGIERYGCLPGSADRVVEQQFQFHIAS